MSSMPPNPLLAQSAQDDDPVDQIPPVLLASLAYRAL